MITGDNILTAISIGFQIGMGKTGKCLTLEPGGDERLEWVDYDQNRRAAEDFSAAGL